MYCCSYSLCLFVFCFATFLVLQLSHHGRERVALLLFYCWHESDIVRRIFLRMPCVGRCVSVAFPGQTHLLFCEKLLPTLILALLLFLICAGSAQMLHLAIFISRLFEYSIP